MKLILPPNYDGKVQVIFYCILTVYCKHCYFHCWKILWLCHQDVCNFTGAKRLYVPDGTQNQYGWRQRARFSIRIFAGIYIHFKRTKLENYASYHLMPCKDLCCSLLYFCTLCNDWNIRPLNFGLVIRTIGGGYTYRVFHSRWLYVP